MLSIIILPVYEDTKIKMKNHHEAASTLVDKALGIISHPCCMRHPIVNHNVSI